MTTVAPEPDRYRVALGHYETGLSAWMLLLGLWQWALIVGLTSGAFLAMSSPVKVATMFLAAADLVAAAGMWMGVAWGRVIFVAAAAGEVALHTAFIAVYGAAWLLVVIHVLLLLVYAGLALLARGKPANTA
jgi:hypothetical protein